MFIPKGCLSVAVALIGVFVTATSAVSIANQDLERYFRASSNQSQVMPPIEERILRDTYTYAFIRYQYMEDNDLKVVPLGDDQARYGEGRIKSVEGKLVHITDTTNLDDDMACSSNIAGTAGNPLPPHDVPWIALVRRSHCTFEEKVRNVHEKGAIGVIIYNDRDVTSLEKMQIKGKNRDITAVITYNSVGAELVSILNRGMDVTASIIQGLSGERPVNTLNRTSVLFVSVSFIVLMLISLVWLIFYYIQRFRYLQTKDQQSRQLCSVTKKAIMKIPTKTGKQSDEKDGDGDCCAVCIEAYKPTDCIRVLPCKHEFHKNCIDPWLIEHRTCPMCKLDVLKFYGYVFLGSEESILEYEANAAANAAARPSTQTADVPSGLPALVATAAQPQARGSVLVDLIRSRDFVIDFPRVFVLAPEATIRPPPTAPPVLFPTRLPERSQSTLSLVAVNAKDWISQVSNKLDEQQHGAFRRALRKSGGEPDDMQENLLSLRMDSVKRRRSRSADARYSHGPRDLDGVVAGPSCSGRRTLTRLTQASYGQSSQRQREDLDGAQDVHIQIQINGEGVDLN